MSFILKSLTWILIVYGCAFLLLGTTLAALAEIQVLLGNYLDFGDAWWANVATVADFIAPMGYVVAGH